MDEVISKPECKPNEEFDSLSLYHHVIHPFDKKLNDLFNILNLPKEFNLHARFQQIESILNPLFRLELLHHLSLPLPKSIQVISDNHSETHPHPHPQILLHFWCLLECTDSLDYIAQYLELTIEEVRELIRELHHTFSIDSLTSRIRKYYETNKSIREYAALHRKLEELGLQTSLAPMDTQEERRQRLRRRYGYLSTFLEPV